MARSALTSLSLSGGASPSKKGREIKDDLNDCCSGWRGIVPDANQRKGAADDCSYCLKWVGVQLGCHKEQLPAQVTLHVYDVGRTGGVKATNGLLQAMGTGIYHAGVEIYGLEWSFAYRMFGHGIFCSQPRKCFVHTYRQSIPLGYVKMSRRSVQDLLCDMTKEWHGESYSLLRKNCCHFCDEFVQRLGLEPIPKWVLNLAGAAASVEQVFAIRRNRGEEEPKVREMSHLALCQAMIARGTSLEMDLPQIEQEADNDIKFAYMAPEDANRGVTEPGGTKAFITTSRQQSLYDVLSGAARCCDYVKEHIIGKSTDHAPGSHVWLTPRIPREPRSESAGTKSQQSAESAPQD